jgi:hypothetical protein
VGLTRLGRPELVVTGMAIDRATWLLNCVASLGDQPHPRRPGECELFVGGVSAMIEFVKVARPWAHLHVAVRFYGADVRALQLVHADSRGHWPWEARYRGEHGGQPVLGIRGAGQRQKRAG